MARPSRRKRVCKMPSHCEFYCDMGQQAKENRIRLSVEEYETIRLMDYMSMTQAECAEQMQVARTTVQGLYRDARRKIARFLVEGTGLIIEGGEAWICGGGCAKSDGADGRSFACDRKAEPLWKKKEGDIGMKLAVTYEKETGEIFQHFGHTETFKIYETEDGKIVNQQILDTNGTGHGALAGLLAEGGVSVLICGGIGGGARNALAEAGIEVFPGAMGDADANVASFLEGTLNYDPDTMCSHHGADHTCGGHEGGVCGGSCHS